MSQEVVNIGPWGAIGSLITFLGTIVGLVVWLVKANMKRQEQVTNRYMDLLEGQVKSSNEQHARQAQASLRMAEAVNRNTDELKELTKVVSQCQVHAVNKR